MAPRDVQPGRDYDEEIVSGIENTRAVVLLLSADSNESRHVKREVEIAFSQRSVILPIRIQNVLPGRRLKYYLSGTQWIDAWQRPIEQAIESVAAALKTLRAPVPQIGSGVANAEGPAKAGTEAQASSSPLASGFATEPAHDERVTTMAMAPDGQILATAASDGSLRLWDVGDGVTLRHDLNQPWSRDLDAIFFSPSGTKLATFSRPRVPKPSGLRAFWSELLGSRPPSTELPLRGRRGRWCRW